MYIWVFGRINYFKIKNVFREDAWTTKGLLEGMVVCVEVDKHMKIFLTGAFKTVKSMVQVMLIKFFLFVRS